MKEQKKLCSLFKQIENYNIYLSQVDYFYFDFFHHIEKGIELKLSGERNGIITIKEKK